MIEKFTQEEIEQIKKELQLKAPYNGSKKTLLEKQYTRIGQIFTMTENNKKSYAKADVWDALVTICDHTLENYCVRETRPKRMTRYASIHRIDDYRELMENLIDVIEDGKITITFKEGGPK